MRALLTIGVLLLVLALPGASQPLTGGPFTLDAEAVTLREDGPILLLAASGGVRYQQAGKELSAGSAELRLAHPAGGSIALDRLQPVQLIARGQVRWRDAAQGATASAGTADYAFAAERLRLTGQVNYQQAQPALTASAQSVTVTQGGAQLEAVEGVTVTVAGVQPLDRSASAGSTVTIRAQQAIWTQTNARIEATGSPVMLVQGGLTLTTSTLVLIAPGGTVQTLTADSGVTLAGDLEGRGERMELVAASAVYQPATARIEFAGPVTLRRGMTSAGGGMESRAERATLRLSEPRHLELFGLQVSGTIAGD